jgi:transposase
MWVDGIARRVMQAPKLEPRIMRDELTDHEWAVIKPMLPNKPRGVSRANDRRVLNGIFCVLRSGAPWRDLPQAFGPYTACYNRFVRWRPRAGEKYHVFKKWPRRSRGWCVRAGVQPLLEGGGGCRPR